MPDTTQPDQSEAEIRPFSAFLQEQDRGRTHDVLSQRLHELIAAVQETGKGGSLTLKIDVKPIPGTNAKTLTVTDAIAAKIPAAERPKTIFFVTEGGNLSRNDPTQPVITGLREVEPITPTQIRKVN